ncbi:hypothetical protein TNCV_1782101 [Trichonephila clavipes]|nr:hypothetical protein TNCV_1782101 [Trichonephila clavipes]
MSSGRSLPQFNLGVQDGIQGDSHNYTGELNCYQECIGDFPFKKLPRDSSGIIIFKDSKPVLQAIQKNKGQISHIYPIPALNSNRIIASKLTKLRTKHVKGMQISTDDKEVVTGLFRAFSLILLGNLWGQNRIISIQRSQEETTICRLVNRYIWELMHSQVSRVDEEMIPPGYEVSQSYPNCLNVQLSPQYILSCPAIQARLFKIRPEDPEDLIFADKAIERLQRLSSTASE